MSGFYILAQPISDQDGMGNPRYGPAQIKIIESTLVSVLEGAVGRFLARGDMRALGVSPVVSATTGEAAEFYPEYAVTILYQPLLRPDLDGEEGGDDGG